MMSEEVLRSARPQGRPPLPRPLTLAYPMLWQPTIVLSSWGGRRDPRWCLPHHGRPQSPVWWPSSHRYAVGRVRHRRNSDWYGHARVPPVCGNPV